MRRLLLRPSWLLVVLVLATGGGCRRHAATTDDCAAVLDRLVELELEESGYRDPVVRARWAGEVRRKFASDLERCPGLRVRNDLQACLRAARTSEAIVHGCAE
ncbi:MAG TPA: hypothetical protein VHK47_21890 [Polyangia bacterium]|jgi:hypothetical protein|nr:hypothetical protein [Polyangia bacterium]